MEKQDLLYGVAALALIIIIAVIVKPIMTGQPLDIGLPQPTPTPTPALVSPITLAPGNPYANIPAVATVVTTPTPVPRVTWDKNVKDIVFVDPSKYGVTFSDNSTGSTRIDSNPVNTTMVTFATISGRYSGTSQIVYIPFPYWEVWYTVEPSGSTGGKDQKLSTSTITGPKFSGIKGSGSTITVIEGSYSTTKPVFTVEVMDGDDPNRIVRTFTPPGGIDESLWSDMTVEDDDGKEITIPDPRPWKEKFFEGEHNYFFIVNSQSLDSYLMEFKVPQRYVENTSVTAA